MLSYGLFLQSFAAILHIAAPYAIGNRAPARRWIKIDAIAGAVVFLALAFGYFFDAYALL